MSSSNSGRHALLRAMRELCFERSLRLPRRLRRRGYAVEPLELRTLLSAVTPDSFTLVESGTPGQLGVLHERDWDADAAPEWLATFGQQRVTQTAGINQKLIADDFVAVDVNKTYGLSGWARSGDNFGMRFNPLNQQSFGFEEYDSDYLRIEPQHVLKYDSAADTTLAASLNPGDTQIVLNNITGWSTSSNAATRALAWYGYRNKAGTQYANYTYTRNVATGDAAGLWSPGGVNILTRTISLNAPWSGPALAAGTAVRNATAAGADHSSIVLNRSAVAGDFTSSEHVAIIGGGTAANGAYAATQFAPGTAFVRAVIVTNQHGQTDNFVTWQDVRLLELPALSTVQDVRQPVIDMSVDLPGNQTMRLPLYSTGDTAFHIGTQAHIQVSPTQRYNLSIDSLDMTEEDLNPVGFYSYDADGKLIHSLHVTRHSTAVDTRLARAVQPGDTAIYINDATGWSHAFGSTAESRSFAWYGYRDSSGTPYADYTYTRNVAFNFLDGLWNVGGITFDAGVGAWKITLRSSWSGPAIPNGTAVRNATGHDLVQPLTISTGRFLGWFEQDDWSWVPYTEKLGGGVWQNGVSVETAFRPGTKFIQPTIKAVVPGKFSVKFGPVNDQGLEQDSRLVLFDDQSYVRLNRSRQTIESNQVAVSPDVPVTLSVTAAIGTTMNSGQMSAETHSIGYVSYDADGLKIEPHHVQRYSPATDTTLAASLRPGDTEIRLTDATGWSNVDVAGTRAFAWFGYRDSSGRLYEDYTYTRNVATDVVNGLWDLGGISGNVITLRQPWAGPTINQGTAVRNAVAGDELIPVLRNQLRLENQWTSYSATLSGSWVNGTRSLSSLPPGVASIRFAIRVNESHFTADDTVHIRNATISKSTAATAALQANNITVATLNVLANDSVGTGNFSIVGVSSPRFGTTQVIVGGAGGGRDAVRYQSNTWFSGTDQFLYTLRNNATGETWSTSATVTIAASNLAQDSARSTSLANQSAAPSNHDSPPEGTPRSELFWTQTSMFTIESGRTLHANDSPVPSLTDYMVDADNDVLAYQLVSGVSNGFLSLNANGTFEYTSNPGFAGWDSFEYLVTDGVNHWTRRTSVDVKRSDERLLGRRMSDIALAFHNFHEVYSRFGIIGDYGNRAKFDAAGNPKLSWRVYLLPYLGHSDLFAKFRLDEAWDSPNNLPLLSQMPDVYRTPGDSSSLTNTRFQTISDLQDLGSRKYLSQIENYSFANRTFARISGFVDGTSNSILFLQTAPDVAVPWTTPVDVDHDPVNPYSLLGNLPNNRFNFATADGAVHSLSKDDVSSAMFNSLVTINGGEIVDPQTLARFDQATNPGPILKRATWLGSASNNVTNLRNRLKQFGLAMHNYLDTYSRFPLPENPSSNFDANGKPFLSWRVHLLPYLEQGALYQQFRLNEPWNSDHNLPLMAKMPDIFRSNDDTSTSTTTRFQVLTGPSALFGRDLLRGLKLGPHPYSLTDGWSNTALIVETGANAAVPWTAPDDVIFAPSDPLAALGNLDNGVLPMVLADGSTMLLGTDMLLRQLKSLASRDGGEINDGHGLRNLEAARSGGFVSPGTTLKNQLKSIALGMHNYHDVFNMFPVAFGTDRFGADGKPDLSWRVHLLPWLEMSPLYEQFHLDESWDSPHNIQLLPKMPQIFRSLGDAADSSTTRFQVFTGTEALFENKATSTHQGPKLLGPNYREMTDGTSNTILVVEADQSRAVPWTKSDDLEFDPNDPLGTMGFSGDETLTFALADGSVRSLNAGEVQSILKALITPRGGEEFSPTSLSAQGTIRPGITVAGVRDGRLLISEGQLGAVQLVLDKPGNVTLDVASSVNGVVQIDKTTLTFTTSNWNVPQAVTLKAINDDLIDGAESVVMTLSVNDAATMTNEFDALPNIVIPVFNVNDDVPRILTAGVTGVVLTEGGAAETISVSLSHAPLSNLTIAVNNSNPQQWTSNVSNMVFTPSNWNVPQILTLLASNDAVVDGTVNGNVRLSVFNSADVAFRGLPEQPISVQINDNDVPSMQVTMTDGETVVSEDGLTDTLNVRLAVQPANDVYVTIVSLVNPTVQISSSELHFTPSNWNVSQTITVSAINESLTTSTILELRADSRSGPYQAAAAVQTNIRVLDDESAHPVFSNVNDPIIAIEGGQAASMSVRLSVAPMGPMQLKVLAVKPDELNVQNGVLQFDATNWNQPQTVTIIAVDEEIADGTRDEYVRFVWGPNLSAPYLRQPDFSVGIQTIDNEVAVIEVVETDGSTVVTESGATDSFGVRLSSRPNGPVELTVTSRDLTAVTVSPSTLRFTPENWNRPQTVTVVASDDVLGDGVQLASIRLAVNLAFSSGGYNHSPFVDVSTTTLDNELATLILQETGGATIVSESGTNDVVQVRLSAVPTSAVTVQVSVDDSSEVGASISTLTFTASNWNITQSVTLTGLDDALVDGPVISQLRFAFAASSPGAYASALPKSVAVTASDNEIAGLVIVESGGSTLVSEAGSSDTITVRLTARPVQNVILTIQSLDTSEFTVSPVTLTFTPVNWNAPQTVTIVGVDDSILDGSQTSALRIRVDSVSQLQFQGITTNVLVTTSDDELAVPSIVAPESLISSQRPTIVWTPVAGATSYRVIVVNRTTGGTVIVNMVIASSRIQVSTDPGIGAFSVRVQAISITGRTSVWSQERQFRIDTAPTMSPIPLYVDSPKPTFKWSPLVGAVYYDLQVDSVLDIRPQIIRRTTLTGTSFVAPANLRLGLYEVKIRAIDAGGVPSKWSLLASFFVTTAPTPLSPPTATFSVRPRFSWRSVDGAIAYDLKYQKSSTGPVTEVNGLQSTTFVPPADLVSGAYRWWVRARGMYDVVGSWSALQAFTIGGSPTLIPISSPSGRNPRIEWSRVEGAVRYFLRVDRIDVPQSYYIRQESLTATTYSVPVSLKPGLYRVWVRAISGSGQVTGWSRSIDIKVVNAEDDREVSGDQRRKNASFLPNDILIPELGAERTRVSAVASEEVIVVQSSSDVSRVRRSVDLQGAREVEPILGINQEIVPETEVLQKVTQAVFEAADWYSLL